jgi:hypothetical protein
MKHLQMAECECEQIEDSQGVERERSACMFGAQGDACADNAFLRTATHVFSDKVSYQQLLPLSACARSRRQGPGTGTGSGYDALPLL